MTSKEQRELPVALHDLTWPEIEERKRDVKVVIIPIGSTEQHGPHLRLATDTTRAYKFSLRVARELYPKVLVAPPIPVGISAHHMGFTGSMTLRPSTLINLIIDYVSSLRQHGFEKLFIINAHGGNHNTIGVATESIRQEEGLLIPFLNYKTMTADVTREVIESGRIEHSGEWEVSDAMFLAPELVKEEALSEGGKGAYPWKYTDLYGQYRVDYPVVWHEITNNGAMGDARKASYEKGRALNDKALERVVEFLEDYIGAEEGQ